MSAHSGSDCTDAEYTDRKVDQHFEIYVRKLEWVVNYPDSTAEMKAMCEATARKTLLDDCSRLPDATRATQRANELLAQSTTGAPPVDPVGQAGGRNRADITGPPAPGSGHTAAAPAPSAQYAASALGFGNATPSQPRDALPKPPARPGTGPGYNPDLPEEGEMDLQQLFNIGDQGTTQFNQPLLDDLCQQIGDRQVAIISTAGKFRQGKTFWNNVLLRALQRGSARFDDSEYIGGRDGIRFRGGYQRHTQGIMVWPKIFIRRQRDGTELAVMLLDTQGTFDNCSNIADSTVIFAISLLMSSLNVYNTKNQLDAQDLDALNGFISFGKKSDERIGQHFLIMMRDSNEAGLNPEYLKLLKMQTERVPQLRDLLNGVLDAFEKVDCYTVPPPSDYVRQASGEIKAGDCGELFLNTLCGCADYILDNLQPKTVLGTALTGQTLKEHVENLITHIKDNHHRAIGSAFTATSCLSFERARSAGNDKFADGYDKYVQANGHRALPPRDYDAKLEALLQEAVEAYRGCPLFGHQKDKTREFDHFKHALEDRCKEKSINNKDRFRDMQIAEAVNGGLMLYEKEMKPSIEEVLASGKKGRDTDKKHEAAFAKAMKHFETSVVDFAEEVELLGKKRDLLHEMITARFETIQSDNAIMLAQEAARDFFEQLLQDYERRFKEKVTEVETAAQIEAIQAATRTYCISAYGVQKSRFVSEFGSTLKGIKAELLEQMLDNYMQSINYRFKKCEDEFAHEAGSMLKFKGMTQKIAETDKQQKQWKKEWSQQMREQKQANKELERQLEEQKRSASVDPMMLMIQQMNDAARRQEERAAQEREERQAAEVRREANLAAQRQMELEMRRMELDAAERREQAAEDRRRQEKAELKAEQEQERLRKEAAARVAEQARIAAEKKKKEEEGGCSIM